MIPSRIRILIILSVIYIINLFWLSVVTVTPTPSRIEDGIIHQNFQQIDSIYGRYCSKYNKFIPDNCKDRNILRFGFEIHGKKDH